MSEETPPPTNSANKQNDIPSDNAQLITMIQDLQRTVTEGFAGQTEFRAEQTEFHAEVNNKLDRIISINPAAAEFPDVTLAASEEDVDEARATWTYGLYKEMPVLMSSAHNFKRVEKVVDKENRYFFMLQLTKEVRQDIEKKGLEVVEVGFDKTFYDNHFAKLPSAADFALLKLNKKPDDGELLMDISARPDNLKREFADFECVVGTSLSGTVSGKGMVYEGKSKCFRFLAEFCEPGNSGTSMFAVAPNKDAKFVGVFKGTTANKANHWNRGVIVPVPKQFHWLRVVSNFSVSGFFADGSSAAMYSRVGADSQSQGGLLLEYPKTFPSDFTTLGLVHRSESIDEEYAQSGCFSRIFDCNATIDLDEDFYDGADY